MSRQLGELVEDPAGRDEQVSLGPQVGAARFHQVHHRQPVGTGDLQRTQGLAQRVGIHRAAADGRVVRDDHALDAGDDPDTGHDAGPDGEAGAPRCQRGQLEERAVRVDEQLNPFPGQQQAPVAVPLLVALPAGQPSPATAIGLGYVHPEEPGVPQGLPQFGAGMACSSPFGLITRSELGGYVAYGGPQRPVLRGFGKVHARPSLIVTHHSLATLTRRCKTDRRAAAPVDAGAGPHRGGADRPRRPRTSASPSFSR